MIYCVRVKKDVFLVSYDKVNKFYKTPSAPASVYKFMTDKNVTCRTANNGDYVYRRISK